MISRCEVVWNEAPESKTQSSSGLSTTRSNASCTSSVTALAESSSFFFFGLLHYLLKWPVFPQFQHCTCWPDLDLFMFQLEFLDFDLPWFEFLSLPLPLISRFRAEPNPEVSPASFRRISSARIKSRISLYLSFSFPVELLTAILIVSQLFGKKAKMIRARISSSKSISIDDNWFVIVLNSFKCYATDASLPSSNWKISSSDAPYCLRTTFHTYRTKPSSDLLWSSPLQHLCNRPRQS